MTGHLHKLAGLRALRERMRQFEQERQARHAAGEDHPIVDRDAAQLALTVTADFLMDQKIETKPLMLLLSELAALTAGSGTSPMLAPLPTGNRRPDPPVVETVKGRLAALMEHRQRTGSSRKEAAAWVVRHMPEAMVQSLGGVRPVTVSFWLSKWGGERGATPGDGREGYERMRAILDQHRPSEPELMRILAKLAERLPARESN